MFLANILLEVNGLVKYREKLYVPTSLSVGKLTFKLTSKGEIVFKVIQLGTEVPSDLIKVNIKLSKN